MNNLYYSPQSLSDLDEIWKYIQIELQNPVAAQKTVSRIIDTLEKLRDFSELGPALASITEIESDYRYLVCGKYISFYRVSCNGVYIDRILYGKRDYMHILFGENEKDAID